MTPPNVICSHGNNAFSNSRNCGKDMTAVLLL